MTADTTEATTNERPAVHLGLLDFAMAHVSDVAASVAFYRDVLSATVIEDAAPHWARVRLSNVDIGLHGPDEGSPAAEEGTGGFQLHFRVADVASFRRHLERHGARVPGEPHDIPGGVVLDFADPDGNRLAAVQYGVTAAGLAR